MAFWAFNSFYSSSIFNNSTASWFSIIVLCRNFAVGIGSVSAGKQRTFTLLLNDETFTTKFRKSCTSTRAHNYNLSSCSLLKLDFTTLVNRRVSIQTMLHLVAIIVLIHATVAPRPPHPPSKPKKVAVSWGNCIGKAVQECPQDKYMSIADLIFDPNPPVINETVWICVCKHLQL